MIWYILAQLYSTLIELLRLSRISTDEKDIEILILRQQLDVMERKNNQVLRPSRGEKWSLAVLAAALKKRGRLTTSQLGSVIRIFRPETVIGWHRELERRKWAQTPVYRGGRPAISSEFKGGALSTMIYTSYITAIPHEIEESAELDGANPLQYIYYVLLPLLKVPMAALTVVYLPLFWNLFLQPFVYLDTKNATLLPFIQHFSGQNTTNFQAIYTTIFISILPLVIVYLMFRRWFIHGALAGAIKG